MMFYILRDLLLLCQHLSIVIIHLFVSYRLFAWRSLELFVDVFLIIVNKCCLLLKWNWTIFIYIFIYINSEQFCLLRLFLGMIINIYFGNQEWVLLLVFAFWIKLKKYRISDVKHFTGCCFKLYIMSWTALEL